MNILETGSVLLKLCPIPTVIQDIIMNILIGFGTPSANAIKSRQLLDESEIPIKVVAFASLNKCRYTLYYMERAVTHYYDEASYFSKEALFEMYSIYLKNKRTTQYTITKLQDISNHSYRLSRERLIQLTTDDIRQSQISLFTS